MQELLHKHNPIWFGQQLETGTERSTLHSIVSFLSVPHIIAISGARRSGKSFLLKQLIMHLLRTNIPASNIVSMNFEDPFFVNHDDVKVLDTLLSEYRVMKNPSGKVFVFLDEIQNIPGWHRWLRDLYDRHPDVKVFITGSNSELLSVELASHLTGRVLAFENFPFSFYEYLQDQPDIELPDTLQYETLYPMQDSLQHYVEKVFQIGLFPEIINVKDSNLREEILRQYFQQVLFKDIVPKFSIRNSKTIEQLAYYCSTTFASRFSYHRIASAVGSNENTIKEYLSYLEKAYLFFVIEHFSYSLKKQTRYAKKIYISDEGLRNATASSFSPDTGRHAENVVFLHLRRETKKITFWQDDQSGAEIDFVIQGKHRTVLCNVSYTNEISQREYKAFSMFLAFNPIQDYQCLLVTRNVYKKVMHEGIEIQLIPMWLFLLDIQLCLPD
jgi:predicted AAA+ superfamily ATPase